MSFEPILPDPWSRLRRFTAARIALGRTGGSQPTRDQLAFTLDHALARDAVHAPFDAEALANELRALPVLSNPAAPAAGYGSSSPAREGRDFEILTLTTAAPDRATFLQRPDLGRRLSAASAAQLSSLNSQLDAPDLVVLVSDGLSALAAHRQAPRLLAALLPRLRSAGFTLAPVCIVPFARVGLMDEVGALLRARLALMLLGERPGLGTPDSLGAYFVFAPRTGRTNADRNCVSNIRPAGFPPEVAAEKLAALLATARDQQRSGIALKDESGASPPSLAR